MTYICKRYKDNKIEAEVLYMYIVNIYEYLTPYCMADFSR